MRNLLIKILFAGILAFISGQELLSQTHSTYLSEIKMLKDKYNVTFVYDSSLSMDKPCKGVGGWLSLRRSLMELFKDSGIEYEIRGRTVILHNAQKEGTPGQDQTVVIYETLYPSGHNTSAQDTLRAALVEADRIVNRDAGTRIVALPAIRTMVSATGESDAIKYIQTLPGVSTGGEGSSAIYVRGGNLGSNLTTLDGVPLYGGSHLLGLANAVPTDIISSVNFRLGGFRGDESNITASHIDFRTEDGSFTEKSYTFSASTFILGGSVSTPLVKDKVSLLGSIRVSPLGPLFRIVQGVAGGALDSLSRPRAVVYDAFAKIKWLLDSDNQLSFTFFNSKDGYSYRYGDSSDEQMGWNNIIASVQHSGNLPNGWTVEDGVSYNRFSGRQGIIREMDGTLNNLAIVSSLNELTADAVLSRLLSGGAYLRLGVRERLTIFNPGTSATFKGTGPLQPVSSPKTGHISHGSITTLHAQWDYSRDNYELMASAKMNVYGAHDPGVKIWKWRFNPEGSILSRLNLFEWMSLEATADWTSQYHHTLEGIPVGWSVDLLVPTNPDRPPEHALQFYAGLFTSFGKHRITAGAYDKRMYNLVYFLDASQLFSPIIAGWSHNIKVGTGTSRGAEFLYEKDGDRLNWRIAYTLSKTDRTFDELNNGEAFRAKFDRRHILNATASFTLLDNQRRTVALTGLFTWQSGHRETVAAGEYLTLDLFGGKLPAAVQDFYTGINNYELPPYIRLDLGCNFTFKANRPQTLGLGVYNVLNRHNPFSIIYDDRSREWKQVSLIPIMPSFSYKISF